MSVSISKVLWAILSGLVLGVGLWAQDGRAAGGGELSPSWESFEVAIEVEETGDFVVTETQIYAPGAQAAQEQTRRLALDRIDAISDVRLFEDGNELAVSTRVKSDHVRLRWHQPPRSAVRHTVVLQYRVKGGVYVHADGDQLVWPALAAEREGVIRQGVVSVRVPDGAGKRIQQFMSYGVAAEADQVDERTVRFTTRDALQVGEGLDVKVVLPHGRLDAVQPDWQQEQERTYVLPGILGYIDTAAFIIFGIVLLGGALYIASERSQGYTAIIRTGVNGQIQVVDQGWPTGETGYQTGESH